MGFWRCQDVQRNCSPCPIECDVHAAYNQTIIGKTVSFADNSHAGSGTTITSWFWDFGDGNNSSLQHPTHTYATTGAKTVCLTVTGVNADGTVCTDTYCFVVKIPCPGDFNGDGVVNIADFLTFLGLFNTICP
jgi:PKD repeat protein